MAAFMAALFAACHMNAAAALWRARIVEAGDFIANGFRVFGIGHVFLVAITR
jgi:hypothetical protein